MDGLISFIVWVAIAAAIFSKAKKKQNALKGKDGKPAANTLRSNADAFHNAIRKDIVKKKANPLADKSRLDRSPSTVIKDEHNHKFGNLSAVMEDRQNDWLARQLREEAKHKNDFR